MIADVITIFPAMIEAGLAEGVVARARERGLIEVRAWDLRAFTDDRHRTVDDVPYGGGPGMVMKPEPLFRAVDAIASERGAASAVVLLTPQGERFTQAIAERLSRLDRLVLICGRYEGVDERVADSIVTDELSLKFAARPCPTCSCRGITRRSSAGAAWNGCAARWRGGRT
jgi:tRNA (guanine37-N1)-methyltransferase